LDSYGGDVMNRRLVAVRQGDLPHLRASGR
jgi:hypothetical protein